eukprot:1583746-Rhodomonas_salina.1
MWDEPWKFPAIQIWVSLLQRFEGFSNTSNFALIKAILDLLKQEKRRSVYEVTKRFEKTLVPIAGHFTTVEAFQSFLLANLRAHAIMQSAQSRDTDARAW